MAKKSPAVADKPKVSRRKAAPSPPEKTGPKLQVYDPSSLPPDLQGYRMVWAEASTLSENPDNWRLHPERQMEALGALMDDVGWAGVLLYNETTGRLVDGHARKKLKPKGPVPVFIGRWTPEQEHRILMSLDPISAMAEADVNKLRELTKRAEEDSAGVVARLGEEQAAQISKLTTDLNTYATDIEAGAPGAFLPSTDDYNTYYTPKDDSDASLVKLEDASAFPKGMMRLKTREEMSWEEWGEGGTFDIPKLRLDRLAPMPTKLETWMGPETKIDDDTQYLHIWGSAQVEKTKIDGLIVAFYTADEKFESVWSDPMKFTTRLINAGVKYIIAPNYSCYTGMHRAWDIWQTYRNRWLARYFQEAGLLVIPDLLLGNLENEEVYNWRFSGIPKGCPCVAVQLQQKGEVDADTYYTAVKRKLTKALGILEPKGLICYVPPDLPAWFIRELPKGVKVITTKTFMSLRSEMLKERSKKGDYLNRKASREETE